MRVSLSLPLVVALAAALPSQTWAPITPLTVPSVRRAGAMAFDGVGNRLIMYGGTMPTPSTILNETWAYNNGNWTLLNPTGGALARWGHRLVRDTTANRLITFGGRSPTISGFANDTYAWNGSSWAALPTPVAPPARYQYGMCYDSTRHVVVLFGGRTAVQTVGDTWEFDGITWTQRTLPVAPAPREDMLMVYDAGFGRTLLFGGFNSDTNTVYGDTWQYNGTAWSDISPAMGPTPRYRTAYAYDSVRQRPMMYGGYDGMQVSTQTYEWNGSAWVLLATGTPGSLQATEMYAAFHPVSKKFVTFGGVGTAFSNETFEFTGSTAGLFTLFGAGCATGAVVSGITAAAPPTIGQPLSLTFDNLPLDSEFLVVALGLSITSWQGIPLPLDLGVIGLGGCDLLVAAENIQATLTAGGTAPLVVNIPNQVSLLNQAFFVQGLIVDIEAPGYGFIGASRAGRALIGN